MGGGGDCNPCKTEDQQSKCASGTLDMNSTNATCGSEKPTEEERDCIVQCCRPRVPRICCNTAKPPVPDHCQGFDIVPRGNRNFLRCNALRAIRTPARKPEPRYVDSAKGNVHKWCNSGYARYHVNQDDFGKVPEYICKFKEEFAARDQQRKLAMCAHEREVDEKCRHLNEDERRALICGLKQNWDETFREFMSLPLSIDNAGKIKKKGDLEEALKALETDIQTLERHDHIFVGDANRSFYLA